MFYFKLSVNFVDAYDLDNKAIGCFLDELQNVTGQTFT